MRVGAPAEPRVRVGLVCSLGIGAPRGGRETNEDNYLVCRDGRIVWRDGEREHVTEVAPSRAVLVAVADGMGGHEDGEVASSAAVQALSPLYLAAQPGDPEETLRAWMLDTHRRLYARHAVGGRVKMGTTLTTAWLHGDTLTWAHVGDSRLYHWRQGQLTRVTRDQTRAEFARRDRRPPPSAPQALSQNFIYGSRGLGDDVSVRIDKGVDTGTFRLLTGDRLLLCSDGLSGAVADDVLAEHLGRLADPGACAVALLERAIAVRSDDNITALVLSFDGSGRQIDPATEWADEETTLVPL